MNALIVQPTANQAVVNEVNLFLEHVSMTKSNATLKTYTSNLSIFVTWLLDQDTNKGLKSHLEAFKSYVGIRYNSAKSKNLALSVIRTLFKYLYESGVLDHNPAVSLKNFKVSAGHSKSGLSKYQLHDVLEYLDGQSLRNRVLMSLLFSNGLRANEAANILIEDIVQRGENMVVYVLAKGFTDKGEYSILIPETYALIRELIGNRTDGHLFQSNKGGGLSSSSISKIVKKVFRECGIDEKSITCHSCRHTSALLALKGGANIMQVKQMLRHKHLSSTNVYLESMNRDEDPAEKMVNIYAI